MMQITMFYALILEHELCFDISNIENEGVLYFYPQIVSIFKLNLTFKFLIKISINAHMSLGHMCDA